jgi:hypothetical protein
LRLGVVRNWKSLTFEVFGSHAWAHIPSEKRKDLEPKIQECIFVGYPDGVKGYRLLNPFTKNIFIERSVKFEEGPYMQLKKTMLQMYQFLLMQISPMDLHMRMKFQI